MSCCAQTTNPRNYIIIIPLSTQVTRTGGVCIAFDFVYTRVQKSYNAQVLHLRSKVQGVRFCTGYLMISRPRPPCMNEYRISSLKLESKRVISTSSCILLIYLKNEESNKIYDIQRTRAFQNNLCRGYIHATARAMWIVPVYSTLLWEGVLRFKMFIYEEISMPQTRVDQYEY